MNHPTYPIIHASHVDPEFDQLNLNLFLLKAAYACRVRNIPAFWLVMNGHSLITPESNIHALDKKYSGTWSLASRASRSTWSACTSEKITLYSEYHAKYGGLYRLNVQDVLLNNHLVPSLGKGCHLTDEILTVANAYLTTVRLSRIEDMAMSGPVFEDRSRQDSMFNSIGLHVPTIFNSDGIEGAHQKIFDHYRSDLFVLDADFHPFTDTRKLSTLRSELQFKPDGYSSKYVHIWYSRNPVNGLEYGHGGVKCFPREAQTLRRESSLHQDFTLGVGDGLVIHPTVLGEHRFNTSPESTWTTAAKEVAKLTMASKKGDLEASNRQVAWLTRGKESSAFYSEYLAGSQFGANYPDQVFMSMREANGMKHLYQRYLTSQGAN